MNVKGKEKKEKEVICKGGRQVNIRRLSGTLLALVYKPKITQGV